MKRLASLLLCLCLTFCFSGCARRQKEPARIRLVASFYPIYIMALNLTDGIEGIELSCMASQETGCLHDFQLQSEDMKALEAADAILINGAGMESFLNKIFSELPELTVIDSSPGIALIAGGEDGHVHKNEAAEGEAHSHENEAAKGEAHSHENEAAKGEAPSHENENAGGDGHGHKEDSAGGDTHNHGEANAHLWVSVSNCIKQVHNLSLGLIALDPQNADAYRENERIYSEKLLSLRDRMHRALSGISSREIITFHEAFPYFAEEFGLTIVSVINREPGSEPNARELADTIRLVKATGVRALFAEPQYPETAANIVANETDARVYVLDPCVSGALTKDAYLNAMEQNLSTLLEALT